MKQIITILLILFCFNVKAQENDKNAYIKMLLIESDKKSNYVTPALALAVAKVESNFNPNALSIKGARGVMQIMPRTGLLEFGVKREDLFKPEINIRIGVLFLDKLIKKYNGQIDIALSHYNGGSAVGSWPNVKIIPATYPYVLKVLKNNLKNVDNASNLHKSEPFNLSLDIKNSKRINLELSNLINDIDNWISIYEINKLNLYNIKYQRVSKHNETKNTKYSLNVNKIAIQGAGTSYRAFY